MSVKKKIEPKTKKEWKKKKKNIQSFWIGLDRTRKKMGGLNTEALSEFIEDHKKKKIK